MADATLKKIIKYDEEYYMACFGKRVPLVADHGKGVYLYGTDGKKYMDMIGGIAVNTLGHAHSKLTKAVADQAKKVIHCCNYYYNEPQTLLAKKLVELSFADKVFFANSGAEANEGAIKLARGYWYKNAGSVQATTIPDVSMTPTVKSRIFFASRIHFLSSSIRFT